jgi:hypothetical protein
MKSWVLCGTSAHFPHTCIFVTVAGSGQLTNPLSGTDTYSREGVVKRENGRLEGRGSVSMARGIEKEEGEWEARGEVAWKRASGTREGKVGKVKVGRKSRRSGSRKEEVE